MTCVFENLELHRPAKLRYGFVVASSPQTCFPNLAIPKTGILKGSQTSMTFTPACFGNMPASQILCATWSCDGKNHASSSSQSRNATSSSVSCSMVFRSRIRPGELQTKTKERFIKSAIPIQVFVHPAVESVAEEIERVKTESRKNSRSTDLLKSHRYLELEYQRGNPCVF